MDCLGYDRLMYIAAQKIGSHHIHGTWSALLSHYLEERSEIDGLAFGPSTGPCDTHINQFMFIPRIVLHAMGTFVRYVLNDREAQVLSDLFDSTEKEIMRIYTEAGQDAR